MKISNCDALIFDLDGTLYNKKKIAFFTMMQQWRHLRILSVSNKRRGELKGVDFGDSVLYYQNFYNSIGEELSLSVETVKDWYINTFYRGFIGILEHRYSARKNLKTLLEHIGKEFPMAVFSDYAFVEERLRALEIDDSLFSVISHSEEYGVLKPSARPLLDLSLKMGVSADRTLVVGDRVDTDGEAALKAGMMFYHVDSEDKWDQFSKEMHKYIEMRG